MSSAISSVMAGLDPAIHDLAAFTKDKTWMPATSAGMTDKTVRRVER
jgi:hypothetical protein